MDAFTDGVTYGQVVAIVRDVAGPTAGSELGPSTRLIDDLGFDSFTAIRLMIEVDRSLGVDLAARSDEVDLTRIVTIGDLVKLVRQLLGSDC
jgi:acyl carrier protein